ncbi:hypothetical protein CB1_000713001 [Camelus ferus]|nr:hypothetical protein CB1_000713001 [Camelus ferus]
MFLGTSESSQLQTPSAIWLFALLVLSALAEKLLPEPGAELFCRTVQAGLAQAEDALTRKRARYLLQRAVEVSAELGAECAPPPPPTPARKWHLPLCPPDHSCLTFWEGGLLLPPVSYRGRLRDPHRI